MQAAPAITAKPALSAERHWDAGDNCVPDGDCCRPTLRAAVMPPLADPWDTSKDPAALLRTATLGPTNNNSNPLGFRSALEQRDENIADMRYKTWTIGRSVAVHMLLVMLTRFCRAHAGHDTQHAKGLPQQAAGEADTITSGPRWAWHTACSGSRHFAPWDRSRWDAHLANTVVHGT